MAKGNSAPQGNGWQNNAGTMGKQPAQRGGSFGMNSGSGMQSQKPMMPGYDSGMVNRMNQQNAGMAAGQNAMNNLMGGNFNMNSRGGSGFQSNMDAIRNSGNFQPPQQNNMSGLMGLLGQFQGTPPPAGEVSQFGNGIQASPTQNWRGGPVNPGMFPNARF